MVFCLLPCSVELLFSPYQSHASSRRGRTVPTNFRRYLCPHGGSVYCLIFLIQGLETCLRPLGGFEKFLTGCAPVDPRSNLSGSLFFHRRIFLTFSATIPPFVIFLAKRGRELSPRYWEKLPRHSNWIWRNLLGAFLVEETRHSRIGYYFGDLFFFHDARRDVTAWRYLDGSRDFVGHS